jgi:hypothetical protein
VARGGAQPPLLLMWLASHFFSSFFFFLNKKLIFQVLYIYLFIIKNDKYRYFIGAGVTLNGIR